MMKTKKIFALLRPAALLLALATATACDEQDFSRSAGKLPGDEELAAIGGVLRRVKTPEQVSILKLDEGVPTSDAVVYRLTRPAGAPVTVAIDIDPTLLEAYNKGKEGAAVLPLFPADKVSFEGGKTLTVAAGDKSSAPLELTFSREGVEKGMYLLPLRATVDPASGIVAPDEDQILYYRLVVAEHIEESELYPYHFKIVGYVNTEEINPLIGLQFTLWWFNMNTDEENTTTWIDMEVLRKATIKQGALSGRATLELGSDLQYVLNNRDIYVEPLQKSGRKVLLCIQGGNTGLGFCNLTDAQIDEFVYQLRYVVENYGLDGVNFIDIEAAYGKDGMPAVDPASYPKLIKATKKALDKKLVTIACDAGSTDLLSRAQEGIEAGTYIDYAWPAIFDKAIDAYVEGAELKPIAGLAQSKYGGALLQTHTDSWFNEHGNELTQELKELHFQHSESANVYAFWDMPSTMQGTERGAAAAFAILTAAMTDDEFMYDGMVYDLNLTREYMNFYGSFDKKW